LLGRAREKEGGGFYRRVEAVPPHRRGLQELQHGRGAVATCGGADGQWGMAVRPPASAHRPCGTGLGLHASVTASSAQCRRRGPRTAGLSSASACAREPGTARLTWRRAGDVVRGSAGIQTQFRLALFKLNFLQKFKRECSKL
jgi:surface antigen